MTKICRVISKEFIFNTPKLEIYKKKIYLYFTQVLNIIIIISDSFSIEQFHFLLYYKKYFNYKLFSWP